MTDKRKKPIEDETDWIYVLQLPTSISSFFFAVFYNFRGEFINSFRYGDCSWQPTIS